MNPNIHERDRNLIVMIRQLQSCDQILQDYWIYVSLSVVFSLVMTQLLRCRVGNGGTGWSCLKRSGCSLYTLWIVFVRDRFKEYCNASLREIIIDSCELVKVIS